MSFPANKKFFQLNTALHHCLLWLSVRNIVVKRVQIKNSKCLIETEQAVPEVEVTQVAGEPYARANLKNCQIIWRQLPEGEVK